MVHFTASAVFPRRRLLELLIRNPPPHQQSAINNSLIRLFVCLRGSSCPFVDIVFPFIACRSEAKPQLPRIPKRTGEPTLVSVHCEGINGSGTHSSTSVSSNLAVTIGLRFLRKKRTSLLPGLG